MAVTPVVIPTTGTDPKVASKATTEAAINVSIGEAYDLASDAAADVATLDTALTAETAARVAGDAAAIQRANHTGTQAIATVTGLQTALDGKATAAQGALADTAVQPADLEAEVEILTAEDARLSGLIEGESGPSYGYSPLGVLKSVALDSSGRVTSATASATPLILSPGADGVLRDDPLTEAGPSAGWLDPEEVAPVNNVETGPDGSLLGYRAGDGVMRVPESPSRFAPEVSDQRGPSVGWLDSGSDSLAQSVTTDRRGAVLAGRAEGGLWHAVDFIGGQSGLARRETAQDAVLARRTGTTLVVPPARIRRGVGWLDTPAAAFTSAAPASTAVAAEATTLIYAADVFLTHQSPRSVVVTRVSDSAVLVRDVDYALNLNQGTITGLLNIANTPITVAYTGHKIRQEVVSINPITMGMALTAGAEVARTATMWPPALPAGHIPLFRVFRSVDGMDVVPVYLYRKRVRSDRARDIEAEIAEQRRRARPIRQMITDRALNAVPLKWGGYGDSITAMGGGTPVQVNELPNGPRQRMYYFDLYDAPTQALIPTLDLADGYGNTYVREGFNWRALRWLEVNYAVTPNYRNWGIGGTNSSDTVNVSGTYNMRHPDRLAALVADACDVVLFSPGMNELGQTTTYGNVRLICEALLAAGTLVILLPSCRTNTSWQNRNAAWRLTCGQIRQVADDLDLPYCDTTRLFETAALGAIPISEAEICDATLRNHPGKVELDAMGDLVIELL